MRPILQTISWLALVSTVFPSVLFLLGNVQLDRVKWIMLLATIIWFVATPLWMGRELKKQ